MPTRCVYPDRLSPAPWPVRPKHRPAGHSDPAAGARSGRTRRRPADRSRRRRPCSRASRALSPTRAASPWRSKPITQMVRWNIRLRDGRVDRAGGAARVGAGLQSRAERVTRPRWGMRLHDLVPRRSNTQARTGSGRRCRATGPASPARAGAPGQRCPSRWERWGSPCRSRWSLPRSRPARACTRQPPARTGGLASMPGGRGLG